MKKNEKRDRARESEFFFASLQVKVISSSFSQREKRNHQKTPLLFYLVLETLRDALDHVRDVRGGGADGGELLAGSEGLLDAEELEESCREVEVEVEVSKRKKEGSRKGELVDSLSPRASRGRAEQRRREGPSRAKLSFANASLGP